MTKAVPFQCPALLWQVRTQTFPTWLSSGSPFSQHGSFSGLRWSPLLHVQISTQPDSRGHLCLSLAFSVPLPPLVCPTNYSCLGPFKLLCLLNSVRSPGSIWVPHSCSAAQKLPPDNKVGQPQRLLRFVSLLSEITFLCLSVISYIA